MSFKLADGDITKIVAIVGGVDFDEIDADYLNTNGVDITCAIAQGYELGMGPSASRSGTQTICEEGEVAGRGQATYVGNLTFVREGKLDADENESAYLRAAALFTAPDLDVTLFRRGGVADALESVKPHTAPFVDGDVIEAYGFLTDYPQYRTGSGRNNDATFTIPLLQQSRFRHRMTLSGAGG